jgi:hypothetical protein
LHLTFAAPHTRLLKLFSLCHKQALKNPEHQQIGLCCGIADPGLSFRRDGKTEKQHAWNLLRNKRFGPHCRHEHVARKHSAGCSSRPGRGCDPIGWLARNERALQGLSPLPPPLLVASRRTPLRPLLPPLRLIVRALMNVAEFGGGSRMELPPVMRA